MSDIDLDLHETEVFCVLLPCHGLTDQLPFYIKSSKDDKKKLSDPVKGLPLNLFSAKDEKIANMRFYSKDKKSEEYPIWIKLNRIIYVARMIFWPNVKRKMSKEIS